MMTRQHPASRLASPSRAYTPYSGSNVRERSSQVRPNWSTTSQYVDASLIMSGRQPAVTEVEELYSPLAFHRRAVISARRYQAESQIARLEAMRGAYPGWDGRNARSPDDRTIDLAASLLRRLADAGLPIPTATMSPAGNALLFTHGGGVYADIELHANKTVSWLIQIGSGPEIEATEAYDGMMNALGLIDLLKHAAGAIA